MFDAWIPASHLTRDRQIASCPRHRDRKNYDCRNQKTPEEQDEYSPDFRREFFRTKQHLVDSTSLGRSLGGTYRNLGKHLYNVSDHRLQRGNEYEEQYFAIRFYPLYRF